MRNPPPRANALASSSRLRSLQKRIGRLLGNCQPRGLCTFSASFTDFEIAEMNFTALGESSYTAWAGRTLPQYPESCPFIATYVIYVV